MKPRGGFTVVEVLIAVVLLEIGVLALVGTSGLVLRLLGRGTTTTHAAWVALDRLERLRSELHASPSCMTAAGSDSATHGIIETWAVAGLSESASLRELRVTVSYPVAGGSRSATMTTRVRCP
jgi:Tfp pilus assembly protein PilV